MWNQLIVLLFFISIMISDEHFICLFAVFLSFLIHFSMSSDFPLHTLSNGVLGI